MPPTLLVGSPRGRKDSKEDKVVKDLEPSEISIVHSGEEYTLKIVIPPELSASLGDEWTESAFHLIRQTFLTNLPQSMLDNGIEVVITVREIVR